MSAKEKKHNKKKKVPQKKRLVLLDAHAIIHRAYHALPDFSTSKGEPTGGLYGVAAMLMKIIEQFNPDYITACYDLPGGTFRHEAYEEYKAGRKEADDDLIAQIIRSRDLFEAFGIRIYDAKGFEADDILGTIVEQTKKSDIDIIIASGDMDTLQLVDGEKVQVYTLRKGLSDTVTYDEKAVHNRFGFSPEQLVDYKGLRGDPSDNIPGIIGIGEKTATLLIQEFGSIEDIYKKLKKNKNIFIKKGFKERVLNLLTEGEEEAIFSKTLATIRRDAPIKFVLPGKTWTEQFDLKKVGDLFAELEFRTLFERARRLFGKYDTNILNPSDPTDRIRIQMHANDTNNANSENENVTEKEIKEIGIALWVLKSDVTNPTKEDILQYARTDSFMEAKKKILGDIKKQGLDKVYKDIELPIIDIVEDVQSRGIKIDKIHAKKLSKQYHKKLTDIQKNIYRLAGREFNINSPKQLGEVLFDELGIWAKGLKKTSGGARSTRESELAKLSEEHEIVSKILEHREIQKLLSTYIDPIPNMTDGEDRLHSTLNQAGTTTGRFSSTNPNLQNIPARDNVRTEIRNMFVAAEGYTFAAFDYSQIEMRILAELSRDKTLLQTFKEGGDVHSAVAAQVFGVSKDNVTKDMRRQAKVINFGIIYGMGVNALRAQLGGTRVQAQEFYNNYFKKLPDVAKYFDKVKKDAAKKGYTETLFSRRRYIEAINSHIPYIKAAAERQALNAPIQGTATGDIIKIAMYKVYEALKEGGYDKNVRLLLQVHDELIYEIKDSVVKKATPLIKEIMEKAVTLSVPLVVDVSVGKRWGELE